jgi:hypothetical protein
MRASDPCTVRSFPSSPVPHVVKHGFILPCPRSPTEFSLPPDLPTRRPDPASLGFSDPSTASSVKPRVEWLSRPLRFRSQAFSTSQRFPGKSEFHGLVSCRNRSWAFLLQSLPLTGIAHPSRGHMLPCSHSPACRSAPLAAFSPAVSPNAPAFARLPGFPDGYGSPFGEPKLTSRSPWTSSGGIASFRRLHLLRSLDPPVSPFAPRRVSPTRRPILSWTLVPSRAFSSPASDPLPVQLPRSAKPLRPKASRPVLARDPLRLPRSVGLTTRRCQDTSSLRTRTRPWSRGSGTDQTRRPDRSLPRGSGACPGPKARTRPFSVDPAPAPARRPEHAPSPWALAPPRTRRLDAAPSPGVQVPLPWIRRLPRPEGPNTPLLSGSGA